MKIIEIHQLSDFADHNAMFFINEGIIVDCITSSPLMHFSSAVTKLGINSIDIVYLDNNILVIQCQFSLQTKQLFKNHFHVYSAKSFLTKTNEKIQHQILRAVHWLTWDTKMQYCSKCGCKLQKIHSLVEKKCNSCNLSFFPNLSPAVMVLIQRNHEILLARSPHFKSGMYSAIAGFVDIGETAESAVHREVKEEVGLKISKLEYFGSQSWPFPNSFMIAFKAHYLQGDLVIDPNEIEDARWFKLNDLPELPSYASISRKLIESLSFD